MTLEQFFHAHPRAAVAFSGGTDSAFLLWAAKTYGCDVHAYYMKTAFQPAFELADARRLAGELDIPMTVIETDILAVPGAAANGRTAATTASGSCFPRSGSAPAAMGTRSCWTAPTPRTTRGTGPVCRRCVNWRSVPPCGVRPDQGRSAAPVQGGRAVYLGKTRLRLSGHPHPHRDPHHSGGPGAGGARGGRPFPPGVCRFPGAPAGGRRAHPGDGGADGAGPGKMGGNFGATQTGFYGRPAGSNAAAGVPMRREPDGQ